MGQRRRRRGDERERREQGDEEGDWARTHEAPGCGGRIRYTTAAATVAVAQLAKLCLVTRPASRRGAKAPAGVGNEQERHQGKPAGHGKGDPHA